MLNSNLFQDKKDKEIARLKMTIDKFKRYDKDRKEYYSKSMRRLGELESLFQEFEDVDENTDEVTALKKIILRQKEEIRKMSIRIELEKLNMDIDTDVMRLNIANKHLKEANANLREINARLRKTNYELISKQGKEYAVENI